MKEKWLGIIDRFIEYCLYGIILFIPFSKAGIEIFFGFAFLGFMVKKVLHPDFKFLKSSLNFLLLIFIFFNLLSLFNSGPFLKKSIKSILFKWSEYIAIFFLVQDTLLNRKRIKNATFILLVVAMVVGIDGYIQRFFGIDFIRQKALEAFREKFIGISACFNHYNDFAVYLVVILSVIIALAISKQIKGLPRLTLSVQAILLEMCLLFTFSRGGWLGFIIALLLLLFLSRRLGVILFFCFFIIAMALIPTLKERSSFTLSSLDDSHRLLIWRVAFALIKENPFLGKGLGTFMDYFHQYRPNLYVQYAHNCFLQIWAESGIFSLLSFLSFLSLLFLKGIKAFKKNKDFILLGFICGTFGFLVHSFFDTHLYSLQLAVLFWIVSGLIANLTYLETTLENKARLTDAK